MDGQSLTDDGETDLTALLGSRICHDLISPLGAIGNGIELLGMAGLPDTPEMALISESLRNATARIRFFRIAFGAADPQQAVSRAEVLGILGDMGRGGRLAVEWQGPNDAPRGGVKLAFLSLLCAESAMAWGGDITIACTSDSWTLTATADRLKIDEALWSRLAADRRASAAGLAPAQIQFALLPAEAKRQRRALRVALQTTSLSIRF